MLGVSRTVEDCVALWEVELDEGADFLVDYCGFEAMVDVERVDVGQYQERTTNFLPDQDVWPLRC